MSDFLNKVKEAQKYQVEKPKIPSPQEVYNELNNIVLDSYFEGTKKE